MLGLEFQDDVLEEKLVEVIAAELGVAVAGEDFDDAFLCLHDGDIERAAAQIVDEDALQIGALWIVGERRRRRFIEDAHDLEPGKLASLTRGAALIVVEISGNGDDGLLYFGAQLGGGAILEGAQDHGRDLLGPILVIAEPDLDILAHLALDGFDGAFRCEGPLIARCFADQQLAVLAEADKGRQDRIAVHLEDVRLAVADDGDFAIGGAKIDSQDQLCHKRGPSFVCLRLTFAWRHANAKREHFDSIHGRATRDLSATEQSSAPKVAAADFVKDDCAGPTFLAHNLNDFHDFRIEREPDAGDRGEPVLLKGALDALQAHLIARQQCVEGLPLARRRAFGALGGVPGVQRGHLFLNEFAKAKPADPVGNPDLELGGRCSRRWRGRRLVEQALHLTPGQGKRIMSVDQRLEQCPHSFIFIRLIL